VQCVGENTWSADPPVCQRMKCVRRNVANARASPNFGRHDFGSTVRYTCAGGYRLVGQRDVRCVGENTWSADPPVCERIQCQIRAVANARTLPEGQSVWYSGDNVTYECFVGYLMVGGALSTCRDDTTWSTPKPVCLRLLKCDVPNSIIFPNKDVFQPGEYVAYSCLPGYTLTGQNSTRCLPNGQWTGSRPECQKVRCPNLVVNNGGVSPVSHVWEFGDAATITCDDGHQLAGSGQVINCQANGEWDGAPSCEAITCPDRNVANAVKSLNQVIWHVNDVVSFVCEEGYRLEGQAASTCLENGQWSASLSQC
uniref:Sushi domain-containing protein n=1 Tax=Ciona savignyi TaxID=51511 RepID=H2YG52_CIOSA